MTARNGCQNLYRFIRLRLGAVVSDREIARRWGMEWKSFSALRHGRRQVPRIGDLEKLAEVLGIAPPLVFEVARGVPAKKVQAILAGDDRDAIYRLTMAGLHAVHRQTESEVQSFKAILDRIADGIFTMDVQGRLQDANAPFAAMVGVSIEEIRERSMFDLLPPEQRPPFLQASAAVYATGEARRAGFTILARTAAAPVQVELGLTRIDDRKGQAIGIQGIARDVTRQKGLEDELRLQNATLAATFDSVPAACLLFGKDGTILLANRLVENVCEWTAEEVRGRNAFDVFGNPGPVGCPVTRSFQTSAFEQQVSRVKNRRGQDVFVHRTAGPVLAENGEVEKVIEILVDVTDPLQRGDTALLELWGKGPLPAGRRRLADVERRKFMRVPLGTSVHYRVGKRRGKANASNVGRGGVFLDDARRVPIGTKVALSWTLPGGRRRIEAVGEVAWIDDEPGSKGIGIRFEEVPARDRDAIVRWVIAAKRVKRRA